MPRGADFKKTLCTDIDGLSLHAAVRCSADDRQGFEQSCRYITSPRWPTSACKPTPPGKWY